MGEFESVAIEAARKAGSLIARDFQKPLRGLKLKGDRNVVTLTDIQAEGIILNHLKDHFPTHNFLTEESGQLDGCSDYTWIIDPLDGTHNFASGIPFCCVSIALTRGDEVLLGTVFDPLRNELFTSLKGEGSFINGKRLKVRAKRNWADAMVALDSLIVKLGILGKKGRVW